MSCPNPEFSTTETTDASAYHRPEMLERASEEFEQAYEAMEAGIKKDVEDAAQGNSFPPLIRTRGNSYINGVAVGFVTNLHVDQSRSGYPSIGYDSIPQYVNDYKNARRHIYAALREDALERGDFSKMLDVAESQDDPYFALIFLREIHIKKEKKTPRGGYIWTPDYMIDLAHRRIDAKNAQVDTLHHAMKLHAEKRVSEESRDNDENSPIDHRIILNILRRYTGTGTRKYIKADFYENRNLKEASERLVIEEQIWQREMKEVGFEDLVVHSKELEIPVLNTQLSLD